MKDERWSDLSDSSDLVGPVGLVGLVGLPLDWCDAVGGEIGVSLREMVVAEPPAAVGGERRRVNRLENKVSRAVNQRRLAPRIATPEDEHEVVAARAERTDGGIGEGLPPYPLMASRLMCPYGEGGVEQHHPLLCPARQVATCRHTGSQVLFDFLEDIDERRRHRHPVGHGETQSHRLTGFVIGILSDNHHLYLLKWTKVEGIENQRSRRVAGILSVFLLHHLNQLCEIGLVKLRSYPRFP